MLVKERVLFLGEEVDDRVANLLVAEMLYLESQDPESEIQLYINSPGGMAYAGFAIYDVMRQVSCPVAATGIGMGMSAAAMILCGGAAGRRVALPSSKIMIHQGTAGTRGAPRDMEIHLREVLANTRRMAEITAHPSGRPLEQVERDIDRDYFLTAAEAVEYGLIDRVLGPHRGISAARDKGAVAAASQ